MSKPHYQNTSKDFLFCPKHPQDHCELNTLCLNNQCPQSGLICYLCAFSEPHVSNCTDSVVPLRLVTTSEEYRPLQNDLIHGMKKHVQNIQDLKVKFLEVTEQYLTKSQEILKTIEENQYTKTDDLLEKFKRKSFENEKELHDCTLLLKQSIHKGVNDSQWTYHLKHDESDHLKSNTRQSLEVHQSLLDETRASFMSVTSEILTKMAAFHDLENLRLRNDTNESRTTNSMYSTIVDSSSMLEHTATFPLVSSEEKPKNDNVMTPTKEENCDGRQYIESTINLDDTTMGNQEETEVINYSDIDGNDTNRETVKALIDHNVEEGLGEDMINEKEHVQSVIEETKTFLEEIAGKENSEDKKVEEDLEKKLHASNDNNRFSKETLATENECEQSITEEKDVPSMSFDSENPQKDQTFLPDDLKSPEFNINRFSFCPSEQFKKTKDGSMLKSADNLIETPSRFPKVECANYVYLLKRPEKRFDAVAFCSREVGILLQGFSFYCPAALVGNQIRVEYRIYEGIDEDSKVVACENMTLTNDGDIFSGKCSIGRMLLKEPVKLTQDKYYTIVLKYLDEVRIMYGEGKWHNVGPFIFAGITKKIIKHWLKVPYKLYESDMAYSWQFPYLIYSKN